MVTVDGAWVSVVGSVSVVGEACVSELVDSPSVIVELSLVAIVVVPLCSVDSFGLVVDTSSVTVVLSPMDFVGSVVVTVELVPGHRMGCDWSQDESSGK